MPTNSGSTKGHGSPVRSSDGETSSSSIGERDRFRHNIATLLDGSGMTDAEFCRKMRWDPNLISRWRKHGVATDKTGLVAQFCRKFGVVTESIWEEEIRYRDSGPAVVAMESGSDSLRTTAKSLIDRMESSHDLLVAIRVLEGLAN